MLFALKMGSYSALKKRGALINIVMIYPEAVSNLVKDWRKRWLEKLWKRQDLLLEATQILESTMFSSGKS